MVEHDPRVRALIGIGLRALGGPAVREARTTTAAPGLGRHHTGDALSRSGSDKSRAAGYLKSENVRHIMHRAR